MKRAAWLAGALLAAVMPIAPALAQDAQQARGETFVQLPYWPGYWVGETAAGTPISGIALRPPPGGGAEPPDTPAIWSNRAPWNDEGRRRVAEVMRTQGGRKGLGWGYPMMMDAATPFQVMITPEETLIVNAYGETRHIYTDGRDFPPAEDMWPTVWGTSIGHWEGDTLVVETVQVQMPFTYFHGAPTFSEEARYFERLRLDGDRLVMEFRVEDPVTLTEPWGATIRHIRENYDRMVQMDFSNDRTGYENGVNTIEPPTEEEAGQ